MGNIRILVFLEDVGYMSGTDVPIEGTYSEHSSADGVNWVDEDNLCPETDPRVVAALREMADAIRKQVL